jgi:hypothetical protein
MLGRHKLLILIAAIILIPILLGMTPLNMAHRLASGGPFTHGRQAHWGNHCPFHSIVSHDDLTIGILNSIPLDQELTSVQESRISVLYSNPSNIPSDSIPLRC